MSSVSIRDLSRNTGEVIDEVARSGKPALVTKRGRVVVAVIPISEEALEDFILASAPEFVRSMREADVDVQAGRTVDAFRVLDEIEKEHHETGRTRAPGRARSAKTSPRGAADPPPSARKPRAGR